MENPRTKCWFLGKSSISMGHLYHGYVKFSVFSTLHGNASATSEGDTAAATLPARSLVPDRRVVLSEATNHDHDQKMIIYSVLGVYLSF